MTLAEPEVRADHATAAELEVAHLVPSWILAGAIFARGLMSLMRKTYVGIGVSRTSWGSVICPFWRVM